jgi:hypothetical protein
MDESIRKKGEMWCVMIGSDRDWEGDNVYAVVGVYICG